MLHHKRMSDITLRVLRVLRVQCASNENMWCPIFVRFRGTKPIKVWGSNHQQNYEAKLVRVAFGASECCVALKLLRGSKSLIHTTTPHLHPLLINELKSHNVEFKLGD